jgi:FMN phosphatase YigB (HAD superfamily)
MSRLALFDLDHTLLPFDSDYEWGQFLVRQGVVDGEQLQYKVSPLSRCHSQCVVPIESHKGISN